MLNNRSMNAAFFKNRSMSYCQFHQEHEPSHERLKMRRASDAYSSLWKVSTSLLSAEHHEDRWQCSVTFILGRMIIYPRRELFIWTFEAVLKSERNRHEVVSTTECWFLVVGCSGPMISLFALRTRIPHSENFHYYQPLMEQSYARCIILNK